MTWHDKYSNVSKLVFGLRVNQREAFSLQHFLHAMDEKFKGHAHYSSRQVDPQTKELERDQDFVIRHYAGDVM